MPLPLDATTNFYAARTLLHSEAFSNSAAFEGCDLEYIQLSTERYHCESREVILDGVRLFAETGNATVHRLGLAWANSYIFAIPCQMIQSGRANGRIWHRTIGAFRGEDELNVVVPPMKLLIASISRSVFVEYMSAVERAMAADWFTHGIQLVGDACQVSRLAETVAVLLGACCAQPEILAFPQARASITHALLDSLSPLVLEGNTPEAASSVRLDRAKIVRKAREFALEKIDEPLQVIDICRAIGVSRRALQYSFQDVVGVNPIAYLRLLRLNGARRDLINADGALQVKDVAARWGFWHWSRFSADYRQMFNELPSETLHRFSPGCSQARTN